MDESHATRFTLRRDRRDREQFHRWLSCGVEDEMNLGEHFRITGGALKNWLIAQMQDSLAVGVLWLIGLYALRVPWAPLWALLAACLQVVPHLGPVLGLIGPVLAAALRWGDWEHPLYVLMLYAVIVVVGWLFPAALYHEARGQGADLGFSAHSDRAGHSDSVLGSAARAAAAGGRVCLQSVAREQEAACGA